MKNFLLNKVVNNIFDKLLVQMYKYVNSSLFAKLAVFTETIIQESYSTKTSFGDS